MHLLSLLQGAKGGVELKIVLQKRYFKRKFNVQPTGSERAGRHELELIQTHMAQKPMLRVEVCARCVARESKRHCVGSARRVLPEKSGRPKG